MTPAELSDVFERLHRKHPGWNQPAVFPSCLTLESAEAYCRELATTHYENFPLIARLLPRAMRQPFFQCLRLLPMGR